LSSETVVSKTIPVYTLRRGETIDYAALELARCLARMDDIQVVVQEADGYHPQTSRGLYLGLLSDLGIASRTGTSKWDDRVYVEASNLAGVIAGSNARSVLMAVYRFLEQAGCRWIRPGEHGEFIPRRDMSEVTVKLDETPSYRYRGMCIEGAVSYENVMESIDWAPKVGMNSFFLEFIVPYTFFDRWYRHLNNPYKDPEALTVEQVIAFRQRLEHGIKKRGLLYHAVGHGWTCEPFGIEGLGWDPKGYSISEEVARYLAEIDGRRAIWRGIPLDTQLCFSNAQARRTVVDYAVRYVQENGAIDVLHVWLADSSNNHCECPNCRDTLPAGFYVELLNEMDAAFTANGIECRIAFIAYLDLLWAPQRARFNNPDRFVLLFAPISRTYSRPYDVDTAGVTLAPYRRNRLAFPSDITENLAYLERWQEIFAGDAFTYEYYFMWDHYFDPPYYETARVIHEDVRRLKLVGLNGMISDQTQRAFFPTGFGMYVLAKTLWDDSVSFDDLAEAYFKDAFGPEAGEQVRETIARLSNLFDPPYLRGDVVDGIEISEKGDSHTWILHSGQPVLSRQAAHKLGQIPTELDALQPVIERNEGQKDACRAQSWEYLALFVEMARMLALAFKARAEGNRSAARAQWEALADFVQRNEDAVQPVLDVFEFVHTLERQFG
jgi:hypothetical protein